MPQLTRPVPSLTLGVMPFTVLLYLAAPAVSADVSVNGRLSDEAKKNVQLTLSLTKEPCQATEWKIRGLFDKSDEEISRALRALGYYHPVIKKSLAFNPKCWQADFTIDSGPQIFIGDITITLTGDARDDPAFQKLRHELLAANGKPLRHDQYEKMKSRLQSLGDGARLPASRIFRKTIVNR